MIVRLNLRLTHFPYGLDQVNPAVLLNNSLMRNHGQLMCMKLARVVNVFPPQDYLFSKIHYRACDCKLSPLTRPEVNSNPLKIFKNQVNYTTKLGKHLYYDTMDEATEVYCDNCHTKYIARNERYAPC